VEGCADGVEEAVGEVGAVGEPDAAEGPAAGRPLGDGDAAVLG
jgi:hypothetical protein